MIKFRSVICAFWGFLFIDPTWKRSLPLRIRFPENISEKSELISVVGGAWRHFIGREGSGMAIVALGVGSPLPARAYFIFSR